MTIVKREFIYNFYDIVKENTSNDIIMAMVDSIRDTKEFMELCKERFAYMDSPDDYSVDVDKAYDLAWTIAEEIVGNTKIYFTLEVKREDIK